MANNEQYKKALDLLTKHEKAAINSGCDRIYDL